MTNEFVHRSSPEHNLSNDGEVIAVVTSSFLDQPLPSRCFALLLKCTENK